MTGRPETQTSTANALFTKSWGYPQCLYLQSLRMPLHPPCSTPNKPRPFTRGPTSPLSPLLLSLPASPLFLSQAPCPNVGILNPNQIKKKKKDKQKDRVFCFVLSCFSSGYICSEKPRAGAFWSTSQMTRLLMGAGQCHIWFHAYSWREPHSWDHALWRGKTKSPLPPTPGMKKSLWRWGAWLEKFKWSSLYFEKRG